MSDAERPWWDVAFAEAYELVYQHRDDASADLEVAGVAPRLRQQDGPVLDACCGNGRHLAAMRRQGFDAWGFDYSSVLLNHARQRSQCQGRLFRADIKHLPLHHSGYWSAVTLFFTAFGYFDDQTNATVLRSLASVLRPGGLLMLDLPDAEQVRANLVPYSQRQPRPDLHIDERRRLVGSRVEKTVTIRDGSRQHAYTESVRLYSAAELQQLAAAAGFTSIDIWRSLHGPSEDHDRQVFWMRRR